MANGSKNNKENEFYKKLMNPKPGSFGFAVKWFFINYVGLLIIFPLMDFIISSISHGEFHYNVVSYVASPAVWALLLTIFDVIWAKNLEKRKK